MSAPTRDEVIRMAREAGTPDPMVFLAAYERLVSAAYARGVAAEREACALLADDLPAPEACNTIERHLWDVATVAVGDAIRERGAK